MRKVDIIATCQVLVVVYPTFPNKVKKVEVVHCVDRIYRYTPSARIDRLIPIWKQPSDGHHQTAASREKEPPPHSRLQTAVSQGIKCLSYTHSVNSYLTAAYRRLCHGI